MAFNAKILQGGGMGVHPIVGKNPEVSLEPICKILKSSLKF